MVASVLTGVMGTGARGTHFLSVEKFQHVPIGCREISSTWVWILRMPKMHSVQSREKIERNYKHSVRLKRNKEILTSKFLRKLMKKAVEVLKYFTFAFTEALSRSGQ